MLVSCRGSVVGPTSSVVIASDLHTKCSYSFNRLVRFAYGTHLLVGSSDLVPEVIRSISVWAEMNNLGRCLNQSMQDTRDGCLSEISSIPPISLEAERVESMRVLRIMLRKG